MTSKFCYFNCSLCLQAVLQDEPSSYQAFYKPEDTRNVTHSIEQYFPPRGSKVAAGHLSTYPIVPYTRRLWVLHRRCRDLVSHLSPGMLGSLMDLVEPTFLRQSTAPLSSWSLNGAFYYAPPQLPASKRKSLLNRCQPIPSSSLRERFPPEIWDMIQQYDIRRLTFIMQTAIQLEGSGLRPAFIPQDRFIIHTLLLRSGKIRIHLMTLGGRTYISRLSDPTPPTNIIPRVWKGPWQPPALPDQLMTRIKKRLRIIYKDFELADSNYLALKSDGMGIIDIALRRTNSKPDWILNATTRPFAAEISEIQHADMHNLTVISDSLKCRAIIPANRTGAEPFFYKHPFPPADAYVDSAFPDEWKEYREAKCPSITYMAKAKYIPFAGVTSITLEFQPCIHSGFCSMRALCGISTSEKGTFQNSNAGSVFTTVELPQPPTTLKISFRLSEHYYIQRRHISIQFDVNGVWMPPPISNEPVVHEMIVENVLGIWWAKTLPRFPPHFGVVVEKKEDLRNTLVFSV